MSDTAVQVLEVVRRLGADGLTVVEVPGWQTRGKGPMTTRARIEHHTATPRTAGGDAPTLRVVTYGHGSLRNSLSRWYVARSGIIYLVALRTSWHAGAGIKGTNATLSGTEAEHSGRADEPWSEASLAAQAAISRHETAVFGISTEQVWEHREHAPDRKVDRAGIDGDAWRRRLATPSPDLEEEFIVREEDQETIRRLIHEEVGRVVVDASNGMRLDTVLRHINGDTEHIRKSMDNLRRIDLGRLRRGVRALLAPRAVTQEDRDVVAELDAVEVADGP